MTAGKKEGCMSEFEAFTTVMQGQDEVAGDAPL